MTTTLERLVRQSLPAWRADATCKGADTAIFFGGPGESPEAALAVCSRCEVREECLQFALDNRENDGIWGGLTAQQRKRLRRRQNGEKTAPDAAAAAEDGEAALEPAVLLAAARTRVVV